MAVTSDSAKVKFWLGDFDLQTESLSLPSSSLNDQFSLEIDSLISPQLALWGDTPLDIYVLLKVDFEGQEIYKNADFDSPSTTLAPSDPDITIVPDASPATTEAITVNNTVSVVKDTDGVISKGLYTITARFVYWAADTAFAFEDGVFTANLGWDEILPCITRNNDNGVPKLTLTDISSYIVGGVDATAQTEFVLYPPQNRAVVTRTYTDIQTATYTRYYTGGNELRYTALLEYDFTNYIVVNAQQEYKSFTILDIDTCAIYDCLNQQWQLYNESTCSGKLREERENQLIRANALATQIITGQGCNKDTYSSIIEEFNQITGCTCSCDVDDVRLIGGTNVVTDTQRQTVTANSATTEVDLSAGNTITLEVSSSTTLDISNIEQYSNYRFIFVPNGGGEIITFPALDFGDSDGAVADVTLVSQSIVIMDFYAVGATKLTLVSKN